MCFLQAHVAVIDAALQHQLVATYGTISENPKRSSKLHTNSIGGVSLPGNLRDGLDSLFLFEEKVQQWLGGLLPKFILVAITGLGGDA